MTTLPRSMQAILQSPPTEEILPAAEQGPCLKEMAGQVDTPPSAHQRPEATSPNPYSVLSDEPTHSMQT